MRSHFGRIRPNDAELDNSAGDVPGELSLDGSVETCGCSQAPGFIDLIMWNEKVHALHATKCSHVDTGQRHNRDVHLWQGQVLEKVGRG